MVDARNARQSVRVALRPFHEADMAFGGSATGSTTFVGAGQADMVFGGSATSVVVISGAGTSAMAFTGAATGVILGQSSGHVDMVFGATATGVIDFIGAGQADMVFGGSATGAVPTFTGAGQADMVFGASAVSVLIVVLAGTAAMVFDAAATSTAITSLSGTATITFTPGNPSGPVIIPAGGALAVASMKFYPVIPDIEFVEIGFTQPDLLGLYPDLGTVFASFIDSPPWTPQPGSLLGIIVTSGTDAGRYPYTITDSFAGTSDWNTAIHFAYWDTIGAEGQVMIWWAIAGPEPGAGTIRVNGDPTIATEFRAYFFELRGQSIRPVGGIGAPPPPYEAVGDIPASLYEEVDVPQLDPDNLDPMHRFGLAAGGTTFSDIVPFTGTPHPPAPSSFLIGAMWCDWGDFSATWSGTLPTGIFDLSTAISEPPGWTTLLRMPPSTSIGGAEGFTNSAPMLIACRNGIGEQVSHWVGEPLARNYWDPIGIHFSGRGGGPTIVGVAEFRSHVLDPAPPVVTEFGVWILGANGQWVNRTCDIRSIDIDRGRSTYTDSFAAATLTITFANQEGIYSAWNPESIWAQYTPIYSDLFGGYVGGQPRHFQVGIPIQVWDYTSGSQSPLFSGTTDSVTDSFPGTVDAQCVVQATDAFKGLARYNGIGLAGTVGDNEFSGQRIQRYATYADFVGRRRVDKGWTKMTSTDLAGVALDKMHEVEESEWGWLYIDEEGTLVFRQRDALQTDPRMTDVQWIFTDSHDVPGTEPMICYQEPLEFSVDEMSIINVAQVSASDSPSPPGYTQAVDAASRAHYGPRTWTRTLPIADGSLGVAQVVVMEYADDDRHIQQLTFNALRSADARQCAIQIRINDRIKVYRHYPGGFLLRQELLVQGIHHTIVSSGEGLDADPAVWDVTIRTATAALVINFGRWDELSPDADGNDHGWDTTDQWGL